MSISTVRGGGTIIREVIVRGRAEGLDQTTQAVKAQQSALDANTAAIERNSRAQLSAGSAYERVQKSVDSAYAGEQRYARVLEVVERARQQGIGTETRHAQIIDMAAARYLRAGDAAGKMGASTKLASHEITQMGAQFSDIAVQLAGGQSPFLVMMQQGAQLSGQLGDRGAKGAIKALGTGLWEFATNPVNLGVVALAALAAGATAAWSAMSSGSRDIVTLDDALRQHAETLRSLRGAYGDLGKDIGQLPASATQARADLLADRRVTRASYLNQAGDFLSENVQAGGFRFAPDFSDPAEMIRPKYRALAADIEAFQQTARAGRPDFVALREAAAALYLANPTDRGLATMYKDLKAATDEGARLQAQLKGIDDLQRKITAAGGPAMYRAGSMQDLLLDKLPAVGTSDPFKERTERAAEALARYKTETAGVIGSPLDQALAREQQAFDELKKSIAGTRDSVTSLAAARAAFEQRNAAIRTRYGDDGKKLPTGESPYERLVGRTQDRMRDIQSEISTMGQGKAAVAAFRVEQDLMAAAMEKGAKLIPGQQEAIKSLAQEFGRTTEQLSQLSLINSLQFETRQMPRADTEITVFERLSARLEECA